MTDPHLKALQNKHEAVDEALSAEKSRPFPDDTIIQSLKKQKLTLKDEMRSFELEHQ